MSFSYKLSYWERETFFRGIDVIIVGSGIVGLSTALHLKRSAPKLKVIVLERGPLPIGASTRNAGFACFGSMTELIADLQKRKADEVWELVRKRYEGLQVLRGLLGDQAMDYQACGGYELFRPEDEQIFSHCLDCIVEFNRILAPITGEKENFVQIKSSPYRFGTVNGLIFSRAEGSIDTGRMMQALLDQALHAGVRIYNGVEVAEVEALPGRVDVHLDNGWTLSCRQLLAATNGFTQTLLPDLEILPARNQVLVTKPIPGLELEGCFHYDQGYYYFRNIHGRVLLGGGRNLDPTTEQTAALGPNERIRQALERLLREVILPGQAYEIDQWWTGILGVGEQKTPILREVQPGIFVSARLGGMGVAIGSGLGRDAAALMLASS
jgi:hypothetical protein